MAWIRCKIPNPKAGEIVIALTAAQTSVLKEGRYVYDVMLISNTDGKVYRVVEGMALVNPGVTDMQSGVIKPSTPPVSVGPDAPEIQFRRPMVEQRRRSCCTFTIRTKTVRTVGTGYPN